RRSSASTAANSRPGAIPPRRCWPRCAQAWAIFQSGPTPGSCRCRRSRERCEGIPMQDLKDLALIIDSHVPIIALETHDETGALQLLTRVALQRQLGYFCWSITEGLNRLAFGEPRTSDPEAPADVLRLIKRNGAPALYALCDFHPYLHNQPEHVRLLKDIALAYPRLGHSVVLISHELELPPELKRFSARFALSLPNDAQLLAIVRDEARRWSQDRPQIPLQSDQAALKRLVL